MVVRRCISFLLIYKLVVSLEQKFILDESVGFKNFLMFVPETLKEDWDVNGLISKLYDETSICGYIVSTSDLGNVNLFPSIYKPFLVIALIRNKSDVRTLDYFHKSIAPFQRLKVIIVIEEVFETGHKETLRDIFNWCWANGIVDVFVIIHIKSSQTVLFTYEPYLDFSIVQLDANATTPITSSARRKDLQGFKIKTIFLNQPPRVLKVRQGHQEQLIGYGVEIIKNFIGKLNGTCVDIDEESSWYDNYTHVADLLSRHEIEFAPYCLFSNEIYYNTSTFTRNLIDLKSCLVVPKGRLLTPALYIIRPFQTETWIAFFGVVVYMSAAEYMFRYSVSRSRDFGKSFCHTILGITLQPMHFSSNEQSSKFRFLRIHTIGMGFIFTNLYLAYMSSFMIAGVSEPDVKSFTDLRNRRYQVLIPSYFELSKIYSKRLPDFVHEVPSEMVYAHSNSFNQSYGFFAQSDYVEMLLTTQGMFQRPVYHVTKYRDLGPILKGFLIWENSPLYEEMDTYLMQITSSGLLMKWRKDAIKQSSRVILNVSQFTIGTGKEPKQLGLRHLSLTLLLYLGGNFLAVVCLALECFLLSK